MSRETIDFGIDLGSVNSRIAMWAGGGRIEVIKNREQGICTPTVVYINQRGAVLVGTTAKNALKTDDLDNVSREFRQNMGKNYEYLFPHSGKKMKPEDLYAEVLKSLKNDAISQYPDFQAAAIAIPPRAGRHEVDATKRAARLAGFASSPLCFEPVATAMAYDHQHCEQDGFWLIFDFGGGTFDASVVQLKDGHFQLVSHQGTYLMNGKLLSGAILNQILIPAVQKEFNMPEFNRHSKVLPLKPH